MIPNRRAAVNGMAIDFDQAPILAFNREGLCP